MKIPFYSLCYVAILCGCASTPQPQITNDVPNKNTYSLKNYKSLNENEKEMLRGSYFFGDWSVNCTDKGSARFTFKENNGKYFYTYFENDVPISVTDIYDVRKISDTTIEIKGASKKNQPYIEYVSQDRFITIGKKRILSDSKIVNLSGENAGIDVVLIKDGFQVAMQSDKSLIKIAPAKIFLNCGR